MKKVLKTIGSMIAILVLFWGIAFGTDVFMSYKGKEPIFCDGKKVYSGETIATSQNVDATYKGIGYTITTETTFKDASHTDSVNITEVFLFGEIMMKFSANSDEGFIQKVN